MSRKEVHLISLSQLLLIGCILMCLEVTLRLAIDKKVRNKKTSIRNFIETNRHLSLCGVWCKHWNRGQCVHVWACVRVCVCVRARMSTHIDDVRQVVDVIFEDAAVGGLQSQQVLVPGLDGFQLVLCVLGLSLIEEEAGGGGDKIRQRRRPSCGSLTGVVLAVSRRADRERERERGRARHALMHLS